MIGCYIFAVLLTYTGTLFGFVGITMIWSSNLKMALVCLMAAGFCDMFDGRIASAMERTKQQKRFGIQIDSLSDLVCFGVLPAMIVMHCSGREILQITVSSIYLLCALIRLAWFNVDEEERQDQEAGSREFYYGLPVTASALVLPLFLETGRMLAVPIESISIWLLLCIAVAFIVPFRLKKPGRNGKIIMLLCGAAAFAMVMTGGSL